MFNALFNSEIKSLGLNTYFTIQSFSTLSRLRMFAMSDALYGSRHSSSVGLDPSISVKIHFKESLTLTHRAHRIPASCF